MTDYRSDPEPGDGRNIDPSLGLLAGEGSDQVVPKDRSQAEGSVPFEVWTKIPSSNGGEAHPADRTYYERPVLKEPVWKWYVPAYFYAGGAAGAAAALGAALQLTGRRRYRGLIRRCRWVAAGGGAVGTALLVADLGRPARFLNMLRVFRPTSPMNLGSWLLSSMAPAAAGSAILSSAAGLAASLGDAGGLVAGLAGPPLAGYTAVLLANTAVPVWQQTRRTLPPLFVSSAMLAAASLLQLSGLDQGEDRIVRRFAVAGAIGDLLSDVALERDAARVDVVARPLHEGRSGVLLRASKALVASSLVANLLPRRWRLGRWVAGVLGTAGAVAVKFGIAEAGKASAVEPRATFRQQRAGLGGEGVSGPPGSGRTPSRTGP